MKKNPASTAVKKKTTARSAASRPAAEPTESPSPSPAKTSRRKSPAKAAAEEPVPTPRTSAASRKKLEIPPILLEGDRSPAPAVSGPGRKYTLGPTPPESHSEAPDAELPDAYGTQQLFLTARDPHWLYAHWDLTRQQQARCNSRSSDGQLILRIYEGTVEGKLQSEIYVHPESRHWFVHVERAASQYAAELGYYQSGGRWIRISVSGATLTPPDNVSAETGIEFATIPIEFPFARLMQIIKKTLTENRSLAQAIEELRRNGHPDLPPVSYSPPSQWTPQQEAALAQIVSLDQVRRVWMGSLEITELIRRKLVEEISSASASQFGISSLSSPFGGAGAEKSRGFWFMVNAELIIYGATEPSAKVTLDGREIPLRPDGSFSFRFALPDGHYELPAVAISGDGTEARAADLRFDRQTNYVGEVGVHPQDPALKPPAAENLFA